MILHVIQGIMVAFVAVFSAFMGKDCWKHRTLFSGKSTVALSAASFITILTSNSDKSLWFESLLTSLAVIK